MVHPSTKLRSMPLLAFLLVIYGAGHWVFAQTGSNCQMEAKDFPYVRGFKLGTSLNELIRRHPKLRARELSLLDPDPNGYAHLELDHGASPNFEDYIPTADTKGLSGVSFAFLDGRVVKLQITYDGFTEWENVSEFLSALAKPLHLPGPDQWQAASDDILRLTCNNNLIEVKLEPKQGIYSMQRPSISFVDLSFEETIKERERDRKARQRRIFKP